MKICKSFFRLASLLLVFGFANLTVLSAQFNLASDDLHQECTDEHDDEIRMSPAKTQTFPISPAVPSIQISTEPSDDATSMYYSPVAAWRSDLPATAQLCAVIYCKNTGNSTLIWEKVVAEWTENGQAKTREFAVNDTIAPTKKGGWSNARNYQTVGDLFYFALPVPPTMTFKLFFKNYAGSVKISRTLKPYNRTFAFPLKPKSLKTNEFYFGGSTHVGGGQVFGYDLGAVAFGADKKLTSLLPGKDKSKNEHYRIYGDSVFAMADGIVTFSMNDCPPNPAPGVKYDRTGIPNSGGGNAFKIRHGDVIALYAHMIEGSLNPDLLEVGSVVKQGDFLGLVGNSGNSGGPHLHVHIVKDGSTIRPLMFSGIMLIEPESYNHASPVLSKWSKPNSKALPGYGQKRPIIFPGTSLPTFKISN